MGAVSGVTPLQVGPGGQPAGTALVPGSLKFTVTNVNLSASYSTGGDTITAQQLGMGAIKFGVANVVTAAATAANGPGEVTIIPQADGSAKLKCQLPAGGEVPAATNLSSAVVQVFVYGVSM